MKLNLLFVACKPLLFGVGAISIVTGGAIVALDQASSGVESTIEISEENIEVEATEEVSFESIKENGAPEEQTELPKEKDNKKTTEKIKVTPSNTEAQQAPAKQTTSIPKASDNPTITKEDPHGSASYNGMSRMQYEDTVKYTCPSQREENIFEAYRPAMSRLISIGKYSAYVAIGREVPNNGIYTTTGVPQGYLEPTWDKYKQYPSQFGKETYFLVGVEDKVIKFYISWPTLSISWGKEDRSKVSTSIAKTADSLSSNWTSYLHQLDNSYKSRCPND